MKINNLTNSLMTVLLVASPMVGAESKYPEPFEPSVVYQDADLIAKHGQQAATAPAASSASAASHQPAAQSKYPEPFEPSVVYKDPDLIAKHAAKSAAAEKESARPVAPAAEAKSGAANGQGNVLTDNLPIIGVVAGLIVFMVWGSKRSGSKAPAAAAGESIAVAAPRVEGETGVARYLKGLPGAIASSAETGVARYLKSLPGAIASSAASVAETGVGRYLKTLPASAVKAAETGVSRYVKNL